MQAQDSAEGKKSEEGGQDPTPPAGAKASRLGIAKEFVDLLFDHDVPQFTILNSGELVVKIAT